MCEEIEEFETPKKSISGSRNAEYNTTARKASQVKIILFEEKTWQLKRPYQRPQKPFKASLWYSTGLLSTDLPISRREDDLIKGK